MIVSTVVRERVMVLLGALACGCLTIGSMALVYSELAMSSPSAMISAWEVGEPMPDHRHRRQALARIGSSIAVNPLAAQQRMDLGRFFAWHAARHRPGAARAVFYSELAAGRFAEAVLVRPTWGFAWALLAEQWAMSGQPQERVRDALRRAVQLAPYEPEVQLKTLWLGLALWETHDDALRKQLIASLERIASQREYFARAVAIALHHRHEDLLDNIATLPWQQELLARLEQVRAQ